jgi:hypothetical protein
MLILLANSRQGPFGQDLGELGQTGKLNPLFWTRLTNSLTVSIATHAPVHGAPRGTSLSQSKSRSTLIAAAVATGCSRALASP